MIPPAHLLSLVLALSLSAAARADLYMAIDANGVITLTDIPRGKDFKRVAGDAAPLVPAAGAGAGLPFAALVAAAAAEHDVPAELLHAVIRAESNYDPAAVSPKGALGLMQLMPATARELGVADARDPAANIRGGAQYLKRLLVMFGNDVALAVAAYNAGPAAILRAGGNIPPFAETRRYVPKVMEQFRRLRAQAGAAPLLAGR